MNVQDEQADREAVGRILGGDTNAFEILLARYQGYVLKILSGHLPYQQVPDTAHEVFVEAFASLAAWKDRMPFKKWLAAIAIRRAYDYWRRTYRNREDPISTLSDSDRNWLDAAASGRAGDLFTGEQAQQEARDVLQKALAHLSPEDRLVLTLVHLEGESVQEAAQLLGWSIVNVKVRAHRSRAKLRKVITSMLQGGG